MGIGDSQSVKTTEKGGQRLRWRQEIKGRKRHILVDTLGLLLGVCVTGAQIGERAGMLSVFQNIKHKALQLVKVFVDSGYEGTELEVLVKATYGWVLEVVKQSDVARHCFLVVPKRWIVERTFGWLNRFRRLSKDYEYHPATSEHMMYWAMIRIMLRSSKVGLLIAL